MQSLWKEISQCFVKFNKHLIYKYILILFKRSENHISIKRCTKEFHSSYHKKK
jgi:hypothetical protein